MKVAPFLVRGWAARCAVVAPRLRQNSDTTGFSRVVLQFLPKHGSR